MSRVFVSKDTGAAIYVFVNDHCPPHVHARHRAEGWTAGEVFLPQWRVGSLEHRAGEKGPIATRGHPALGRHSGAAIGLPRTMADGKSHSVSDESMGADASRRDCGFSSETGSRAQQIVDAHYDPLREQLVVAFRDGTTTEVDLRP
jgi:hypothetical protein